MLWFSAQKNWGACPKKHHGESLTSLSSKLLALCRWLYVMPRAGPSCTANGADVYQKYCVRWEGETTAMTTRTWHHLSPIWALFWYRGYSRGSVCPLRAGTKGSLWFPGWHRLLPFAVALRHKCIVSAWLQFLRIPAFWALGAAASLSPASEKHLYYWSGRFQNWHFPITTGILNI